MSPGEHRGNTSVQSRVSRLQCPVTVNRELTVHRCGHPWPAPAHSWPYRGAGVTPVVTRGPIRTPVLSRSASQSPALGLHKTLHITEIAHQGPDTSLIPWQNTNYQQAHWFFHLRLESHWLVQQLVSFDLVTRYNHANLVTRMHKRESCVSCVLYGVFHPCFTTF